MGKQRLTRRRFRLWLRQHWAVVPVALFYLLALAVFAAAGDRAVIGVPDNLDLFQAQYQMLKNTGTFTKSVASAPFLHGISRDVLPSERSLEALIYALFPSLTAYIILYFVKITIGMVSFVLLAGELGRRGVLTGTTSFRRSGFRPESRKQMRKGEDDDRLDEPWRDKTLWWNLAVLCGLCYGILNLFPSFGIAFASIPLLVWMILRLEREDDIVRIFLWLVLIFCYPFLSYFSYFGIFLVGYILIAFIWKSIADSVREKGFHPDLRLLVADGALAAGSVFFEYRLFRQMLLSSEPTIRETMVQTSLSGREILFWIRGVLVNGVELHCESMQKYLVLPVCLVYCVIVNVSYLRRHEGGKIFHDLYNLLVLILIFNSIIYGLYYSESFRSGIENVLLPLKGFQFNRTAFFNPLLWYGMFYIALYRLSLWIRKRILAVQNRKLMGDSAKNAGAVSARNWKRINGKGKNTGSAVFRRTVLSHGAERCFLAVPWLLSAAAFLVIVFHGNTYNDLLNTAKADVKRAMGRPESDALNYGAFYSAGLFDKIKEEIGYDGEWSVAYGFHPAVLEYNGITTLDGYLGFYSESYKEQFREVIAPALDENEATREYFDDWGARCYIYSGHNVTVVEAVRNYPHPEDTIDIDPEALKDLGCIYIFSRIRITNAEEKELTLVGTFSDDTSPYVVYVYYF